MKALLILFIFYRTNTLGASKMDGSVIKVLATKTENLSSVLGTYTVEGQNCFPQVVLSSPHACYANEYSPNK